MLSEEDSPLGNQSVLVYFHSLSNEQYQHTVNLWMSRVCERGGTYLNG
jgi:hypothetical protein